jgi:hypothetical protein
VRQYELDTDTVSAAVSAGRVSPAGAVALRSSLELARDRVLEQQRSVIRTRAALAALVGAAAERPLGSIPDTTRLAHSPEALLHGLETHPVLLTYKEREALRRPRSRSLRVRQARLSVEVLYGQRTPNFSNMLTVIPASTFPSTRRRDKTATRGAGESARARAPESEDAPYA